MYQTKTLALTNGVDLRERAIGAVRPGVEAMLLAAVALGCAQAAWAVLAPNTARAVNSPDDQQDATRLLVSDVASPFAPALLDAAGPSHAALALLSGVQVSGVRIADDPTRSGAILTLNDGSQQAFMVGQQISAGVTLSEVNASYVLVSYEGGTQQLTMASGAQGFSFARALMGLEQAPNVEQTAPAAVPLAPVEASATAPELAVAAAEPALAESVAAADAAIPLSTFFDEDSRMFAENAAPTQELFAPASAVQADGAWLQGMLARVESQDGRPVGWRVPASMPEVAAHAGLQAGDLVTSVNGAGPENLAQVLLGAQDGRYELAVRRGAETVTVTIETDERL